MDTNSKMMKIIEAYVYEPGHSVEPWSNEVPLNIGTHQVDIDDSMFPNRYLAGPGLDPSSWNGALLVGQKGSLWGIRVGYYDEDGEFITGPSFYSKVKRSDSYADDYTYAKVSTNELEIEWSAISDSSIIAKVISKKDNLRIGVEAYIPLKYPGRFTDVTEQQCKGFSPFVATVAGVCKTTSGYAEVSGRYRYVLDEEYGKEDFCLSLSKKAQSVIKPSENLVVWEFSQDKSGYFLIKAAMNINNSEIINDEDEITSIILRAKKLYNKTMLKGKGDLARCAAPMKNEMNWMRTYHPYIKKVFIPAGRKWMEETSYNLWGWDEVFNAMIMSYSGDYNAVRDQLRMAGCEERVGLLGLWYAYRCFGKKELLEDFYKDYIKMFPSMDSSLVHGGKPSDYTLEHEKLLLNISLWNLNVGKGMDDSPMRESHRGIGEMYSLDMSCYKACSVDILRRIASELGDKETEVHYKACYDKLSEKINNTFWDEKRGVYANRYISGEWAEVLSPTSFYPLFAGVADKCKAELLLRVLKDKSKFWGEYILPTITRDNPEYGKPSSEPFNGRIFPEYTYWRGAIWAPTNFLVYIGLRRYGFYEVAGELAQKSSDIWWKTWEKTGWACENYNPQTGEMTEYSQTHQSWAQLLPLIGLQELVDVDIWSEKCNSNLLLSYRNNYELENIKFFGKCFSLFFKDQSNDGVTFTDESYKAIANQDFDMIKKTGAF